MAGGQLLLDQLDTAGALPVLDAAIRFAGARHTVIAHNIANLETPGFQPRDVDPHAFQSELAEAIDRRRQGETGSIGGTHGELGLETTRVRHFVRLSRTALVWLFTPTLLKRVLMTKAVTLCDDSG